jgi:hypothetical protein
MLFDKFRLLFVSRCVVRVDVVVVAIGGVQNDLPKEIMEISLPSWVAFVVIAVDTYSWLMLSGELSSSSSSDSGPLRLRLFETDAKNLSVTQRPLRIAITNGRYRRRCEALR